MGRRLPLTASVLTAQERMRAFAADQGGVVTAAQCRGLGIDDAAGRRLITLGHWSRARRGVYADTTFAA